METEFSKALSDEAFPSDEWLHRNHETIRRALRIADKLMQEPSEAMQVAAVGNDWASGKLVAIATFRAMRDQMLKEIEQ